MATTKESSVAWCQWSVVVLLRRAVALGGITKRAIGRGLVRYLTAAYNSMGGIGANDGREEWEEYDFFGGYASVSRIMDVLITAHGTIYEAAVRIAPGWPGREKRRAKIN